MGGGDISPLVLRYYSLGGGRERGREGDFHWKLEQCFSVIKCSVLSTQPSPI